MASISKQWLEACQTAITEAKLIDLNLVEKKGGKSLSWIYKGQPCNLGRNHRLVWAPYGPSKFDGLDVDF